VLLKHLAAFEHGTKRRNERPLGSRSVPLLSLGGFKGGFMATTTRARRNRFTPQDTARAMADLHRLWEPTPRERAEERLRRAKLAMSVAAQAVIDNRPDAAQLGDAALQALTAAQSELASIDAEEQT